MKKGKVLAIDYLKAFIIVSVVLHHALLAYSTFLNYDESIVVAGIITYFNLANPVLDKVGWSGFDVIIGINDRYFMTLMFFISGLFIFPSLNRKGEKLFWHDRLKRLGIPFIIGIFTIIPLAYYPAHLQWGLNGNKHMPYFDYLKVFIKSGFNTPGPLWFIYVLLVFSFVGSILLKINFNKFPKVKKTVENPLHLFFTLLILSVVLYLPLYILFGDSWFGVGPFVFQSARILHYLLYFLAGCLIGFYGIDNTIFKEKSKWMKSWWIWFIVGILSFPFFFTLSCICLIFSSFGFFYSFIKKRNPIIDSMARNSFGIYIFHYIFTSWFQYFLLSYDYPVVAKGIFVFIGAYSMSWILTSLLRRIPGFRMIL